MDKPSKGDGEIGEGQVAQHSDNESSSSERRANLAHEKTARQKKNFNQTALTIGAGLGAVLGAAIGFFVPFVIVLVFSTFGGDPSLSIPALVVGGFFGVCGLFIGAAGGYLTARNSAGHFFKGKE